MNKERRFQRIRDIQATLVPLDASKIPAPFSDHGRKLYFLTSVENDEKGGGIVAGRVFDIPDARRAAEHIADGTHRLSTETEIDRFFADLKRETDRLADIEVKRKQQFALPQELQTLVAAAATSLAQGGKKGRETN